jgi:hypothetical protein
VTPLRWCIVVLCFPVWVLGAWLLRWDQGMSGAEIAGAVVGGIVVIVVGLAWIVLLAPHDAKRK